MAETLAEDISTEDRRRLVGAGVLHGRDAEIDDMRASADVGVTNIAPTVIATRGERLALSRARSSGRDQRPEAFHTDALGIVEINADNQIVARVMFDPDDIDAAFAELDARYVAGEAPPTRARGQPSRGPTPRSIGANSPRRHQTSSTIDHRSRR